MNLRSVLNAVGALIAGEGVAMLIPLVVAVHYGDGDAPALALAAAVAFFCGTALFLAAGRAGELGVRDGFGVVTLGWTAMAFFGSVPFLLDGSIPSFTDAFFETMSGFTTTGASILTAVTDDPDGSRFALPRGLLFWRSLIQWFGGMGIIVLSLAILPMLGVGGTQLYRAEVPGVTHDKLTPRIRQTALYLYTVYVIISAAEVGALMLAGLDWYDASCHTFTTMATGGFSTRPESIAAFGNPHVAWIITFFMFLAGANFALHYRWRRLDVAAYFRDVEWRFYLYILLMAALVVCGVLWSHARYPLEEALRKGSFQVVSIMTTTGYVIDDYERWHPGLRCLLFLLMFIGGCGGSTAGSIKVVRLIVLVRGALRELAVVVNPRVVRAVQLGANRPVDAAIARNVFGFFVLFVALFVAGGIVLSACGIDFETSFAASATCLANVGPGLGRVGPVEHFAWMPGLGKWVLVTLMLIGRLEVYTVLALLLPMTWRR